MQAGFGPEQTLGRGRNPAAVVHPDGAVTVAWTNGTKILATTRQAGQAAFPLPASEVASSSPLVTVGSPKLAVDGAGNVSMSWWSRPGTVDLGQDATCWSATRPPVSGAWSVPEPIVAAPGVTWCTHEAAEDGTLTYAWAVNSSVWTRTRSPEGVLGKPTSGDVAAGELRHLALTDNAAGVTALSWAPSNAPGQDLQVSLRAETDGEFVGGDGLSGAMPVTGAVALVVDDAGRVSGGWAAGQGVVGVTRGDRWLGDHHPTRRRRRVRIMDRCRGRPPRDAHPRLAAGGRLTLRRRVAPDRGRNVQTPVALTDVTNGRSTSPRWAASDG